MNRKKHRVAAALAAATELPVSVFAATPEITLWGGQEIRVECCRGIEEYSDSLIRVRTGEFYLEIRGEGLVLRAVGAGVLAAEGEISQLLLLRKGDRE